MCNAFDTAVGRQTGPEGSATTTIELITCDREVIKLLCRYLAQIYLALSETVGVSARRWWRSKDIFTLYQVQIYARASYRSKHQVDDPRRYQGRLY